MRELTDFPFANHEHIEKSNSATKHICDQFPMCHHTRLYYQQLILEWWQKLETLDYWTLIEAQHINLCHHIYSHTRDLLDADQIHFAYIRL